MSDRAAREAQADAAAGAWRSGAAMPVLAAAPPLPAPALPGAVPLPGTVRRQMEQRFGRDFGSVRISSDAGSGAAVRGFGAQALAHGELLRFAEATPDPSLVAHELTHVLQQREAGAAEIACGGTGLVDAVSDLDMKLTAAKSAAERKALIPAMLKVAEQLAAALASATGPTPDADKADEARVQFSRLGSALIRAGEMEAAVQVALKTPDAEAQSRIAMNLPTGDSIASQQRAATGLALLAGEKLTPAGGDVSQGRAWLQTNSAAIGRSLAKLDARGLKGAKGGSLSLERTSSLMNGFMKASSADERPDPTGTPTALKADEASGQILADCDVYATVAARLLRDQGWQTVGYMVVVPHETDPNYPGQDRSAHAVALAKKPVDPKDPSKGAVYRGSSNIKLEDLAGGRALTSDTAALPDLEVLMFDVYDNPKPANYDVYYQPAGAGGALDMRLLDPANKGLTARKSVRPPP